MGIDFKICLIGWISFNCCVLLVIYMVSGIKISVESKIVINIWLVVRKVYLNKIFKLI